MPPPRSLSSRALQAEGPIFLLVVVGLRAESAEDVPAAVALLGARVADAAAAVSASIPRIDCQAGVAAPAARVSPVAGRRVSTVAPLRGGAGSGRRNMLPLRRSSSSSGAAPCCGGLPMPLPRGGATCRLGGAREPRAEPELFERALINCRHVVFPMLEGPPV